MAPDVETVYGELQEVFRRNPMLVVGCGASAATGDFVGLRFPTMADLAAELRRAIPQRLDGKPASLKAWKECDALLDALGLESALQKAVITDQLLLEQLVTVTGELIESTNVAFRDHLLAGNVATYPLQRLVDYLFDGAPAAYPVVNVLTPNYDRLVEYACFASRIPCCTQFFDFGIRCFDPDRCATALTELRRSERERLVRRQRTAHVAVFKPHGSLGWFQTQDRFVELHDARVNLPRVMVTPGATKYERSLGLSVLNHHREAANTAMKRADGLVFYGYGFNDTHLQTTLAERLALRVPTIILTETLTAAAEVIIAKYPHVWALERADGGITRCLHAGGEQTVDEPIWNLDQFMSSVLGR